MDPLQFLQEVKQASGGRLAPDAPDPSPFIEIGNGLIVTRPFPQTPEGEEQWLRKWASAASPPPAAEPSIPQPPDPPSITLLGNGLALRKPSSDPAAEIEREDPGRP